ncbi:chromosome partitioning protein ParB [Nostoc sp. RF31YmG]|nr:chromosome partitioning protein ParB [Nostoc sp. RF31YmG]
MSPRATSQQTSAKTRKPRAKKEDSQDVVSETTLLVDKKKDSNFAAITKILIDEIIIPTTQPRRYFAPKAMQSLVESVRRDGILVPLLVRPVGDKYELVAGERRYKAAKEASFSEVPVTIQEMSDSQAIQYALTENLQREDLNPVEETEGILDLLALRLETDREGAISLLNKIAKVKRGLADNDVRPEDLLLVEEIFKTVGIITPEAFRTHRLPLLKLHIDLLEALRSGQIEYTKAREIDKVSSDSERMELLEAAIEHSLSLSQIREQVKALQPPSQSGDLQKLLDKTYKQVKKSKVWSNPDKQEKLKSLLAELQGLLSTED